MPFTGKRERRHVNQTKKKKKKEQKRDENPQREGKKPAQRENLFLYLGREKGACPSQE